MKMMVIYHTKTGNTKQMADEIIKGMVSVAGVQAKAFAMNEIDEAWAQESKCVVIGSPVYMASVCGEVANWLQGPCMKYGLTGKIGGAFATADYLHGGGELAIRTILDNMMVLGMLTYSGGGSAGKPVIHLGPVAIGDKLEESKETFRSRSLACGAGRSLPRPGARGHIAAPLPPGPQPRLSPPAALMFAAWPQT